MLMLINSVLINVECWYHCSDELIDQSISLVTFYYYTR